MQSLTHDSFLLPYALRRRRPDSVHGSSSQRAGSFFPCRRGSDSQLSLFRSTSDKCVPALRSSALPAPSSNSLGVDAAEFIEASKHGNLVPLCVCIFGDKLDPILAYRCLVKENDWNAPSFILESVESNSQGRYSVVGAQPTLEIVAKENKITVLDHKEGRFTEEFVHDPFTIPMKISEKWKPKSIGGLPDTFCGGWVGYFSYDTMRYVENKKLPFSRAPKDDRNLADFHLGLYDEVVVFDHVEKKVYITVWVVLDAYLSVEKAYEDGVKRLDILAKRFQDDERPRLSSGIVDLNTRRFGPSLQKSNMTSDSYKEAVLQAKEHILAGDIFQIVLSQRFEYRTFANPFEIYRALRIVNPSPYMAYLQARGCTLVGSSPEILTRVKKNKIVNRPLAGTVRRGRTEKEDEMLEKQLLNDAKQCAEHIMLVDLARNDVGKVTGELLDHLSSWDALQAALPVGTVSGAPKVKAMELIDELETTRRGPYGGGFGTVAFNGDMDIALALRTIVFPTSSHYDTMYSYKGVNQRQEWVAHLQAGAGIVADSSPDDEHQECQNKAADLARAIALAESAFVNK
ncbi:anthranilate synthase alpha subunit 1, chloroplastic-like isoform X2 [Cucurbita pepo subsp. pepo]|uniref:anthranilate synthase alpha subunit 1, chloroplastic-like isoform X2 n=1 Tax=Cucurbita pepo subsp. pepo TaxID=3664 RepID=UPI000C9D4215|nr:anthranilate synthase alpha subunit 1, chloroplastic-like isoform X2 [Cucurbita pepo subsp. pepo]